MKQEEAIKILMRKTTIPGDDVSFSEIEEAIDMAIDALKTQLSQECTTKDTTSDTISKTQTVERLRGVVEITVPITDYDGGYIDGIEIGISIVSTMPSA